MSIYKVRLVNSEIDLDQTIEAPDDQYILDMAEEPEAWPGVGQGNVGAGNGQGNQNQPGNNVGDGNGGQDLQIFDDSEDDPEDDTSTDFDPQEQWGEPEPADPNWVM